MKTKFLYHGSNKKISILKPKKPFYDKKDNSMKAVFATSYKKEAIAMALTNQKNSESFITRKPIKINFVKGIPTMKKVYLYYLNPKNFIFNRKNEYISNKSAKPIKTEIYDVSKLKHLWRISNKKELAKFLRTRI